MEVVAAVGTAISYVASASAAVTAGTATLAQTLTVVAVNVAATAALNAASMAMMPQTQTEGPPTEWRADSDAGLQFPFGRVGAAGVINHRVTYGNDNRMQTLFCTVAASGPIKRWVSFSADEIITTFDSVSTVALDGPHKDRMWLRRLNGTQPQAAVTGPDPIPGWTSAHRASGRAVYALSMIQNADKNEYEGGEVKPLHVIEGIFGYDPREDSTYPGGDGPCRIDDPSTWPWIDNPIIADLNWEIGRWEGDSGDGKYGVPYQCTLVGGVGASLDGIDIDAFVNAANIADDNGWKVSAYPTSKDDKFEVRRALLQAGGALPSRVAGRIGCVSRGSPQPSILTVTAADTAGAIEITLGQSRLERINTLTPRFWSENHRWEMTPISPVSDADFLAIDGAKRSRGLDYPYVGLATQAAQLGYYDIADPREPITGTVPFKPHMRRIKPGDCFTFSEPNFLLDGVKVKCLQRSFDPQSGVVKITFRQETDAKHAKAAAQVGTTTPGVAPETPPVVNEDPPSITDVVAVEQTDGIRLHVTGIGPDRDDISWFIRWRVRGSSSWTPIETADAQTGPAFDGYSGFVPEGVVIDVGLGYQALSGRRIWSPDASVDTTDPTPAPIAQSNGPTTTVQTSGPTLQLGVTASAKPQSANGSYTVSGAASGGRRVFGGTEFETITDTGTVKVWVRKAGVWTEAGTISWSLTGEYDNPSSTPITIPVQPEYSGSLNLGADVEAIGVTHGTSSLSGPGVHSMRLDWFSPAV